MQYEKKILKRSNGRFLSPCDRKEKVINREYELYKALIILNKTKDIEFEKEFAAKISCEETTKHEDDAENVSIQRNKQFPHLEKKDIRVTKSSNLTSKFCSMF